MKREALRTLSAIVVFAGLPVFAQTITVTPNNESVVVSGTKQFTATVSGLSSSSVTWSVSGGPAYGSISASGLYTAPPTVPSPSKFTVTATSTVNPSITGSASMDIRSVGPTLTSLSAYSFPAGSFSVTITGSGFMPGAVAWLNNIALTTTYVSATSLQAAGTVNGVGNYLLRVMNPGSMFSNMLTVNFYYSAAPSVTISPAGVSVVQGTTQQFSAQLNGSPQSAVWSAAGGGAITQAGLYTAPQAIPSPATVTISATISGYPAATTVITIVSNTPPQITGVNPGAVPAGVFSFTINGQGFINGSQATLGGTPLTTQFNSATQLTVAGFTSQSGVSNLVVSNGPVGSQAFPVTIGVPNPLVTASAARRFLQQAAFGPSSSDAASVQQLGFSGWLNQQFSMAKVSNYTGTGNQGGLGTRFLTNAVNQPDQLRQRVAFALSQIFVVSLNKNIWNSVTAPFEEMLMTDAFSNFRQILNDVTLAPAMGQFLDMANNPRANSSNTVLPNENYAREVLQLFSIGTVMLNPDGTRQLINGLPVPTYDQNTIANFAKVFTGWTYAPTTPGGAINWGAYINPNAPMVPYAPMHDTTAKTLLQYNAPASVLTSLPANQNAQTDLAQALDNVFYHPNVGPFISRQLIQHLVKSSPSAAYIGRVAAVFADNGQGVRGDMRAVIAAVLLDAEARQNDQPGLTQATDGHLQEPILFLAGFLRAMGATVNDQNYYAYDLANMGQDIYNAPSVFNYFSPGYVIPGFGITGPEFQIYTPYSAVYRDNIVSSLFSAYASNINSYGPGTTVDLTPFVPLAATPAVLVDALDFTLTAGLAPSGLKSILVNGVNAETGGNLRRVQTGLYLLLSSGYYNVWN